MSHGQHVHQRRLRPEDAHKLERPERARWLPPDELLDRVGIRAGMVVADVGAGTGYFALPIARRVGEGGRVVAIDASPEMLELLRAKLDGTSLPVELVHGEAERTGVADACADVVLLVNVWHEVDDRVAAAGEARRMLRSGGRLVVVDWRDDVSGPPGPPADHRLGMGAVKTELRGWGWDVQAAEHVGEFSYLIIASAS